MITLSTLKQASLQDIFNQAAIHLLAQNEKAKDAISCRYKIKGLMCAVGCFISDGEYVVELEGCSATMLMDRVGLSDAIYGTKLELLEELQKCHDAQLPDDWKADLEDIAIRFKLSLDVLIS